MDYEQEQPEEGLIYHYCDAAAFESIIRNNKLWLSPFRHSNEATDGEGQALFLARKSRE